LFIYSVYYFRVIKLNTLLQIVFLNFELKNKLDKDNYLYLIYLFKFGLHIKSKLTTTTSTYDGYQYKLSKHKYEYLLNLSYILRDRIKFKNTSIHSTPYM